MSPLHLPHTVAPFGSCVHIKHGTSWHLAGALLSWLHFPFECVYVVSQNYLAVLKFLDFMVMPPFPLKKILPAMLTVATVGKTKYIPMLRLKYCSNIYLLRLLYSLHAKYPCTHAIPMNTVFGALPDSCLLCTSSALPALVCSMGTANKHSGFMEGPPSLLIHYTVI